MTRTDHALPVSYISHAIGRDLRALREVFGKELLPSALPFDSPPFQSHDAATVARQALQRSLVRQPEGDAIVQPGSDAVPPMSEAQALDLMRRGDEWVELLRRFRVEPHRMKVMTKDHPRCWVVSAAVSRGIPPGMGFVVDKYSERVFPQRYIDVVSDRGDLV